MPRRLHDCPSCCCMVPEDGESMTVSVNDIPVPPGELTIGPYDQVKIVFTKTTKGDTP